MTGFHLIILILQASKFIGGWKETFYFRSEFNFYKTWFNMNVGKCIHLPPIPHSTQTEYIHIFCESCFMSRLRTRTINNEGPPSPARSQSTQTEYIHRFRDTTRRNLRGPAPAIRSNSLSPDAFNLTNFTLLLNK